jgi:outer membrane protein OmpA-like peptidoglycan-associated protein
MDIFSSNSPNHQQNNGDYYLSISDLMSALVLILCLLAIVFSANFQEAQKKIDDQEAKLEKMKDQLEQLRAVRQNVVLGLTEAFKAQNIDAKVDPQTGDVSIKESLLFPRGSFKLTKKGKDFLERLIPTYYKVIFSKEDYIAAVSHIVIEGHASRLGDSANNMKLSVNRSSEVYRFTRDTLKYGVGHPMTKKLLIAGRGEIDANQDVETPADRKVLFRFRFKVDEQAIDILKGLGSEVNHDDN